MGRRESPLEARAVRFARFHGVVAAKMTGCDGVPDRIFFTPGGPLIVEFKAEGEEPEALQTWYLKALKKAGYRASYCDTWEGFQELWARAGRSKTKK